MQQGYITQKEFINQQPLIPHHMAEETTMENSNSDSDTRQSQPQQGADSIPSAIQSDIEKQLSNYKDTWDPLEERGEHNKGYHCFVL
jgi:nitrate reductase cytochrome c-type subunit